MEDTKKKGMLLPPLFRILRENRRYNLWLALMAVAASLDAVGQILMAWTFSSMVDSTIGKDMAGFGAHLLDIVGLLVLGLLMAALARYSTGRYSSLSARNLRMRLGAKFARLSMPWLEKRRTGDLLSLLGNDLNQFTGYVEEQLRWVFSDVARFTLSLAYMIYLNPWLTLATVAYVPIGAAISMLAGKPVQRLTEEQNKKLGGANAIAQDAVSGHSEVKAFGMQPWIMERFSGALEGWKKTGLRVANAQVPVGVAATVNLVIPYLLLCGVGLTFVLNGSMTGGQLLAFIMVTNGVMNPLMSLTWRITEMRRAAGAASRLSEVLDSPEERSGGELLAVALDVPLVSFRNVSFSYARDNGDGTSTPQQVFAGLDLDIHPGEKVAVVGQSGSGKSTLLRLVAGFYEPDSGQVLFGGHALPLWELRELRSHMALVDQDTYLFPGTIGENIACGVFGDREPASEDQVTEAVRLARLDDFVAGQTEGLHTSVGERGSKLSGGQRQRVAIARAALRNAELLMLDEPTSALDVTTEKEIQRELEVLMQGHTALIVTHRLSMALYADRIVVLDGGAVAEQGTHEQLMERKGLYYALYNKQVENAGGAAA